MNGQKNVLLEKNWKSCSHNGFPVINRAKGTLRGIVSRKQLELLLQKCEKEDDNTRLDMRPRVNRWPYTLGPGSSLSNVFYIFRLLGLRHLIITNVDNKVIGIIGRSELTHEEIHHVKEKHERQNEFSRDFSRGGEFPSRGKHYWDYGVKNEQEWSMHGDSPTERRGHSSAGDSSSSSSDSDDDTSATDAADAADAADYINTTKNGTIN